MATTHRRSLNLASTRIVLDKDDLDALIAVLTSGYPRSLPPPKVALVTETPTRRIDEENVEAYLKEIADIPRPLSAMAVVVVFGDGGQLDVELRRNIARVSANGPLLEWVQRKPSEVQIWFKSRAIWYSSFKPALITIIACFFLLLALFTPILLAPPGWDTLPPESQKITFLQVFSMVALVGLGVGLMWRVDVLLPKALITDRPAPSAKLSDRTIAIGTVVIAVATIVGLMFIIFDHFHQAHYG